MVLGLVAEVIASCQRSISLFMFSLSILIWHEFRFLSIEVFIEPNYFPLCWISLPVITVPSVTDLQISCWLFVFHLFIYTCNIRCMYDTFQYFLGKLSNVVFVFCVVLTIFTYVRGFLHVYLNNFDWTRTFNLLGKSWVSSGIRRPPFCFSWPVSIRISLQYLFYFSVVMHTTEAQYFIYELQKRVD